MAAPAKAGVELRRRAARSAARGFVGAVGRARERGTPPPAGLRRRVLLAAIFRAMPRVADRRRAARVEDAAVEWRVRDGDGGVDIWTVTIADGRCRVRKGGAERPRTRIELGTADLLALAAGHAEGPDLWLDGRVQIDGDVMFAATFAGLFRPPR